MLIRLLECCISENMHGGAHLANLSTFRNFHVKWLIFTFQSLDLVGLSYFHDSHCKSHVNGSVTISLLPSTVETEIVMEITSVMKIHAH